MSTLPTLISLIILCKNSTIILLEIQAQQQEVYCLRRNLCRKNKSRNITNSSSKMVGLTLYKEILALFKIKWKVRGVVRPEVAPKIKAPSSNLNRKRSQKKIVISGALFQNKKIDMSFGLKTIMSYPYKHEKVMTVVMGGTQRKS